MTYCALLKFPNSNCLLVLHYKLLVKIGLVLVFNKEKELKIKKEGNIRPLLSKVTGDRSFTSYGKISHISNQIKEKNK